VRVIRARGEFAKQICGSIVCNRALVLIPASLAFYKILSMGLHFTKIYVIMNTSYILTGAIMKTKTKVQNTKKNKDSKKIVKKAKLNKTTKIIIAAVALVLCIATVLSIVLINNSMSPLEKFVLKLAKKQNFQMEVSAYGIPLLGSLAFVVEMDGNITHIPDLVLIDEECYVEKVGNETFTYTKDENGKWVKTKDEDDSDLEFLDEDDLEELINPDNYELVEGTENVYRQKDSVQFEKFKNITITLEDDSCKIEMIAYLEEITLAGFTLNGIALETQIVISKIGEVNLKLPRVG